MDLRELLRKWVENKIEKIINKDLKEKVVEESSVFDVETYVNTLLDVHFRENYVGQLKDIFDEDLIYSELEYSTGGHNSLNDSFELDSDECKITIEGEIIKNLESNSREVKKKSLEILEASAEDFINHSSWNLILESLQKILTETKDRELYNLVLKIFQKLLKYSKKPQATCKGFISIAKLMVKQIVLFRIENENTPIKQNSDLTECSKGKNKDFESENLWHCDANSQRSEKIEVLIKLMWLLVDCQLRIPLKWMRFNESRFREIIFSFVHLLSCTTTSEKKKLSGLELLSVLNPTATWCRYYCHTAVGRSVLCSALKKYKTFFTHVVEIIFTRIKAKKFNKLPYLKLGISANKNSPKVSNDVSKILKPSKLSQIETHQNQKNPKKLVTRSDPIRSAPAQQGGFSKCEVGRANKLKNSKSDWIVKGIPQRIVTEAIFCHCISFVSCLIQFRSGRALFPLQMPTRKRLLSIQDFFFYLTEYLESFEYYELDNTEMHFSSIYKSKILEILESLKSVKININSARDIEKQFFPFL